MNVGSELNINIFGFLSKHRYVCVCIQLFVVNWFNQKLKHMCSKRDCVFGTVLPVKSGCDSRKIARKDSSIVFVDSLRIDTLKHVCTKEFT